MNRFLFYVVRIEYEDGHIGYSAWATQEEAEKYVARCKRSDDTPGFREHNRYVIHGGRLGPEV